MTVLITGVTGQLGYDVARYLRGVGCDFLSPNRNEMDLSDEGSVKSYIMENNPDSIIHCGAWTDVNKAEVNVNLCRQVNVDETRFIVDCCKDYDITMLYVSTDYVFDGSGVRPWEITDRTNPINQYGLSKRDGENIVRSLKKYFIVRTSWVFGINGKNFIATMVDLSKKFKTIRVVDDQFGSPTYSVDLAPLLWQILCSEKYGTYHAHNEGFCTWYDLAIEVFKILETGTNVIPISSNDYRSDVKRPLNCRLGLQSLEVNGFDRLPNWKDAVNRYIKEMTIVK